MLEVLGFTTDDSIGTFMETCCEHIAEVMGPWRPAQRLCQRASLIRDITMACLSASLPKTVLTAAGRAVI